MKSAWDLTGKQILVLGARGLVGSALIRRLEREDCRVFAGTRKDADLTDLRATTELLARVRPDGLILAAAKVGGILANRDNPVAFLEDNLLIQLNVTKAAHRVDVERLLFLGSSCIYPQLSPQPISETSLMTGPLEPTNDAYALAKICGIRLIDAYRQKFDRHWISAMPTNLYGPNDNFDLQTSHVLPALLRKFFEAKNRNTDSVEIWGTGTAQREFLYVDDCADALVYLLRHYDNFGPINVGSGEDISINDLAEIMANLTGFTGEITHDLSKPDGMHVKRLDVSRLSRLGWLPKTDLSTGLLKTYNWYINNTT